MRHGVSGALVGLLVAGALAGCSHRRLNPDSLQELQRLAIVGRVLSEPAVTVAQDEPREGRAFPTATPAKADAALKAVLARQVRRFEIEERLRVTLLERMPQAPPWTTAMPAVEVSTALQSLLVEERPRHLDVDALAAQGADSVLQLEVTDYGLHHKDGKTAFYLKGEGRMFKIGGATLWRMSLDTDEAEEPGAEGEDVVELREGGYREALAAFLGRVTERVAKDLGGQR